MRKNYTIARISMLVGCWSVTFFAIASTQPEYKLATAVADNYLRSFASEAEEEHKTITDEARKYVPEHQARPAQLDVATIRRVIFNHILAESEKLSAVQVEKDPVLNAYSWMDLKLFYGTTTDPGYNLISRINRTTTILGEGVLATLLVTPTSDLRILQERQQILQTLLNDPQQIAALKDKLKTYQDAEQSMISLWTATDPLYSGNYVNYMESNFYAKGNARSNKSASRLEFKKRFFRDFGGIVYKYVYPLIFPLVTEVVFHNKLTEYKQRELIWKTAIPYYGAWNMYNDMSDKDKAHGTHLAWMQGVGAVVDNLFYTYNVYSGITTYQEYASVLRHLALRMADVQTFIRTADQISQLVADNPTLEALYGKHLTAVRELLARSTENTEVGKLIKYLKTLPLTNWSYFFNNAGKLLACHKLFVEHKKAFADAMYEIGLLDAHLSFATLMQEASSYNKDHAYIFVQFLDRQQKSKPYIKIDNMWNPFLDSRKAVGNNLEMDAAPGGTRNIILTGPNAGGKSTFLTGVTHALLLAHVMGIGPADDMVITPFNKINTYIDIADDIAAGKSLFMAEVDRAQQHIQLLKQLKEDEFSYSIFDEPFSGTNPPEGGAAEYSILDALGSYTNSLNMVATHYPIVMLLEERAKDKGFANYKVYITYQGPNRKLNYTYKIVPGKSTQAIALDILAEQGYDTKMLEKAREILAHPEKYQTKF